MTMSEITPPADDETVLDVAVVGGGMGGLYSAWRLLTAPSAGGHPLRLTVFEGGNRIGGRLLSLIPPGMPHTRCELGGMRFMSRHVLVSELVEHFQLRTEPMPVSEPNNIAFLRGHQLRLSDLNCADKIPYNLTPVEKNLVAKNLLMLALAQIVPNCEQLAGNDLPGLQREMQSFKFDGEFLYNLGFWNVLARILSPDAYMFVRDSNGYDCLVSNWNAADAIAFILADFGKDVTYSRFPDGFDQLPKKLASEIEAFGGRIELGSCLIRFDVDDSGLVLLSFNDGRKMRARKLVLAMPRRSLELIEWGPLLVDDTRRTCVRKLIETVQPIPLFKLFACYEYPWWKAANVEYGRSLTDLPIRQCYYWGVEPKDANTDGNSALLASYDDDLSVSFWAGLRAREPGQPVWPAVSHLDASSWFTYSAPYAMVDEIHRQLMEMHGIRYAPQPYAVAYRDWTEDPYGGGIHLWSIHAQSWKVIPEIVNPIPGIPIYICGEAYSREQGWVEGALQTAELMLTQHFGMRPYLESSNVRSESYSGATR
jgi:monoamine oxidase